MHVIDEANRAIHNDASILFAERNKKRGWKRKKAQGAFEVSVPCSIEVQQGLFYAPANAFLHVRSVFSRRVLLFYEAAFILNRE
jgi:hypothetical protein